MPNVDPATPPPGQIRGVIFDMDGVLVLSEPIIAKAAIAMFKEKGYTLTPEEFRPFIGMGEDRFIGGPAEARGIPMDLAKDKARTYALYLEMIKGVLKPLPGVAEFTAECKRRGLKLAVASSADDIKVKGNLRALNLPPDTFSVVVNGSEVAKKKPAPDIFLEAARQLGLSSEHCLVVEDAIAGVAAAKAAGMKCLAVTTSFPADKLTQADWVAANLAEAPPEAIGW